MAIANTDVLTALARVQHPTLGRDLVALGVVKALTIAGGDVSFTLALPEAAQAVQDNVVRMANEAVTALEGSGTVAITVQAGDAAAAGAPGAPGAAPAGQARPNLVPEVKHVIAVGAGKGGVGKSTVAVNLAVALAQQGASVGLLDADVYGPSIPTMLGLTDWVPAGTGEQLTPPEAHGIKFISIGFFLEHPDQPVIWRGPMIDKYVKQFLGAVLWGPLDYLIVDLPPGTGDVQLSLAQSVPITGSVVVCTPQDVALLDARKAVNMFRKLNAPVLGMVEDSRGELFEAAVAVIYRESDDNVLATLTFRDGQTRPVAPKDVVSGASLEKIANVAVERVYERMVAGGTGGLTLEDILTAADEEFSRSARLLSAANSRRHLVGLPAVDVVGVAHRERVRAPAYRYLRPEGAADEA